MKNFMFVLYIYFVKFTKMLGNPTPKPKAGVGEVYGFGVCCGFGLGVVFGYGGRGAVLDKKTNNRFNSLTSH